MYLKTLIKKIFCLLFSFALLPITTSCQNNTGADQHESTSGGIKVLLTKIGNGQGIKISNERPIIDDFSQNYLINFLVREHYDLDLTSIRSSYYMIDNGIVRPLTTVYQNDIYIVPNKYIVISQKLLCSIPSDSTISICLKILQTQNHKISFINTNVDSQGSYTAIKGLKLNVVDKSWQESITLSIQQKLNRICVALDKAHKILDKERIFVNVKEKYNGQTDESWITYSNFDLEYDYSDDKNNIVIINFAEEIVDNYADILIDINASIDLDPSNYCTFFDSYNNLIFLDNHTICDEDNAYITGFYIDSYKNCFLRSFLRSDFNYPIVVGSGITQIPDNFFINCSNLEVVKFENTFSIEFIGDCFFKNCPKLKQFSCNNPANNNRFVLNNGKTLFGHENRILNIGKDFLYGCESFRQEIVISQDAALEFNIGENFLYGCKSFNLDLTFGKSLVWTRWCIKAKGFLHNCDNFIVGRINFNMSIKPSEVDSMFDVTYDGLFETIPIAFGSDSKNTFIYTNGMKITSLSAGVAKAIIELFPNWPVDKDSQQYENYRNLVVG